MRREKTRILSRLSLGLLLEWVGAKRRTLHARSFPARQFCWMELGRHVSSSRAVVLMNDAWRFGVKTFVNLSGSDDGIDTTLYE